MHDPDAEEARTRELRARLEALNRQYRCATGQPAVTVAAALPTAPDEAAPPRVAPAAPSASGAGALALAVPGTEVQSADDGPLYLVDTPPAAWPDAATIGERFAAHFAAPTANLRRVLAAADLGAAPAGLQPAEVIFLDIETTGLGNTPAFLVGLLNWTPGGFTCRQYLARTYAEEAAMTRAALRDAAGYRLLVTFNGRTFDLPYLRNRALALGVAAELDLPHFDLLPASRQLWRGQVPNCRLQTLEMQICGRPRVGDIPGHEIPAAYHDFVRTGDPGQLREILAHNRLDLLTMPDLMTRFPPPP